MRPRSNLLIWVNLCNIFTLVDEKTIRCCPCCCGLQLLPKSFQLLSLTRREEEKFLLRSNIPREALKTNRKVFSLFAFHSFASFRHIHDLLQIVLLILKDSEPQEQKSSAVCFVFVIRRGNFWQQSKEMKRKRCWTFPGMLLGGKWSDVN